MTKTIREEINKIHQDNQSRKIFQKIADELDERKAVEVELKERLATLEEKEA